MRSGNLFSKRDAAVLDAPAQSRVGTKAKTRGAAVTEMPLRRDYSYADDFADGVEQDGEYAGGARRSGVRVSFSAGLVPKTIWGRVAVGCGVAAALGVAVTGLIMARSFLLKDEHFLVQGSSSIQIAGNSQLTRPQLLSVFGEDVERNIFAMPLEERRAELERLPWVEHATVMRLLPNRVRVGIVERTPVAFVRQGREIGLVDASGVLLEMGGPADGEGESSKKAAGYSFPVLTGISAGEPLSTRAARMKIYMGFLEALDSGGEKVSRRLSEVDLSNPEDVKAILPDGGAGSGVLVHFGDSKFLERYRQYQQHLAEWKTQYPKLASVDMRYERQVVLEMQQGAGVPSGAPVAAPAVASARAGGVAEKPRPVALKATPKPVKSVVAAKAKAPVVVGAVVKAPAVVSAAAPAAASPAPVKHLTTAFAVPSKVTGKTPASQGAPR